MAFFSARLATASPVACTACPWRGTLFESVSVAYSVAMCPTCGAVVVIVEPDDDVKPDAIREGTL